MGNPDGIQVGTPPSHRQRRFRALWHAAGANAVAKVVSVGCLFVQVPIALHYLGATGFGIWTVLTGALALAGIADFGLGSGAQNQIARALGSENAGESYRLAWTTLLLLTGIGLAAAALLLPACFLIDWHFLFPGIPAELFRQIPASLAIVILCWIVGLPLGFAPRLALALQHGWLAALGSALGSVLILASICLGAAFHWDLPTLIICTSLAPALSNGAVLLWLLFLHPQLGCHKPDLTPRSMFSLLSSGFWFFPPTVGAILFSSLPAFIVSAALGPAAVVPYQLLQRLASAFTQIENMVMTPLWPAYTEAHARGDAEWIRNTFRLSLLGSAVLFALPLLSSPCWAAWALRLWTGYDAPFSPATLVWFAVFNAAIAVAQPLSAFLNGLGRMFSQAVFGTFSVFLSLAIMPWLTSRFGLTGTFIAMVIPYLSINLTAVGGEAAYRLRRIAEPGPPSAS